MRRARLPAVLLALVLSPSLARAYVYGPYGLNLRWDQCFADGGVQNKSFACDTNTGSRALVASFVPAWDIVNVSGLEGIINLASDSPSFPLWWQFTNTGACRQVGFTTLPGAVVNCPDWGQGFESGGIGAYFIGSRGPNTATLKFAIGVPALNQQALTGRAEYFAFKLVINNAKTVGAGACGGCTTPVCVYFQGMTMVTPIQVNNRYLTGPSNLTDSDYATWQGGGLPHVGNVVGCPAATPTQQRTWGAVKALYR